MTGVGWFCRVALKGVGWCWSSNHSQPHSLQSDPSEQPPTNQARLLAAAAAAVGPRRLQGPQAAAQHLLLAVLGLLVYESRNFKLVRHMNQYA